MSDNKLKPCPYPEHAGDDGVCEGDACPWWSTNIERNEGLEPDADNAHCTVPEWRRT
jgi:hypothetical protein